MSDLAPENFDIDDMTIRLAEPEDYPAVRELFYAGVEEGRVGNNDTGADIDNLAAGYFADDGESGFWVGRVGDHVIGMVGVQKTSDNKAEIRRLRVRESYRRKGVGSRLMQHALQFCQEKGHLKVALDVQIDRAPAIALFEKSGFKLARVREIDGRKMLDFYLDLYSEPEG